MVANGLTDKRPYTASTGQIYAWAVGAIASHALIGTFGQAYNIFTIGFGLSAVLVSWSMMLPRVFDAITDPILGHLSDNTHTRWGRRKPYLLVASIAGACFVAALYWADKNWPSWLQFSYLILVGSLFYFCYGLYTMAWTALGYELSDDYNERARVAAIASFFMSIVLLGNQWLYWLALRPVFGNEVNGIRVISAFMACIIIASALFATIITKERFVQANKRDHTPTLHALRTTLRNRPFTILLLVKLFQILGDRVFGGLLVFVSVYYVCQGDKSLSTFIGGVGAVIGTMWGFILVPFMKRFSQTLGKRSGLVIPAITSFITACFMPLLLSPRHPYLMLLPSLIVIPMTVIGATMQGAIVPDICDVDELETGQRREGLFTAVMGFVSKMEISLTVLIVGYLVKFSGFDAALPNQPPLVISRLLWLAIGPNILFTLMTLVFSLKFNLSEAYMTDIRRQLNARRSALPPDEALPFGLCPELHGDSHFTDVLPQPA